MPDEIERRFLIKKLSDKFPSDSPKKFIKQGYFGTEPNSSFRIRIKDDVCAELTIKKGKGIKRKESSPQVVDILFGQELFLSSAHKIQKVRYNIGRWEVDFFESPLTGIIIAEIEMKSEDEKIKMPDWMVEYTEVTYSITSHYLARLASELGDQNILGLGFLHSYLLKPIPRIVLTGPPCSGKTSIINLLKTSTDDIRFVPETAALVINELNIKPSANPLMFKRFQRLIYKTQKLFELTAISYALSEGKKAVLHDRGIVDGAAYIPGGISVYESFFHNTVENDYKNYDLVICLELPPKDIYEANKINNPARSEDYSDAERLGHRIKEVWQSHPNFIFVSNNGGWDEKVKKVKEAIFGILARA